MDPKSAQTSSPSGWDLGGGAGIVAVTFWTSSQRDPWHPYAVDRIKRAFIRLDDWDGEGSLAVTPIAARRAARLAEVLDDADLIRPFVTSGSEGGIIFEWVTADFSLELEVTPTGRLEGSYRDPTQFWRADATDPRVQEALSRLR